MDEIQVDRPTFGPGFIAVDPRNRDGRPQRVERSRGSGRGTGERCEEQQQRCDTGSPVHRTEYATADRELRNFYRRAIGRARHLAIGDNRPDGSACSRGMDPPLHALFQMSNTVMLVGGGLAALIFLVIALVRVFGRRSTTKFGEDLTVSRTWLIEHSARKSD
jgi:hypothetical protein